MLLPVIIITRKGVRYVYLVHFSVISKSPRFNMHLFGLNTVVVYFSYTKQVKKTILMEQDKYKYNNVK